jgi:hypothetical protein
LNNYIYQVKRLISGGSDEAKSLFVEYLILSGAEPTRAKPGIRINQWSGSFNTKSIKEILKEHEFIANDKDIVEIKDSLKSFLLNIYIENTQIIFDAAEDINEKNTRKEDALGQYFLENYKKMMIWNGDDNIDAISNHLAKLIELLDSNEDRENNSNNTMNYFKTHPVERFEEVSKELAALLCACLEDRKCKADILFLCERDEVTLEWKDYEDGTVVSAKRNVIDSFATSNATVSKKAVDEISQWLERPSELVFTHDTYHIHGNKTILVKFETAGKGYPIFLAACFSRSITGIRLYKALRYILTFRNKIESLLEVSLVDEQLQKLLEEQHLIRELSKARTSYHLRDEVTDLKALDSPYYADRFLLNNISKVDSRTARIWSDSSAYKQYIDAILGKVNIKLISRNNRWEEEMICIDENGYVFYKNEFVIEDFCVALSSICYLTRWMLLSIKNVKKDRNVERFRLNLIRYFTELFKGLKFKDREPSSYRYPPIRYLVAFIAEILNGAAKDDVLPARGKNKISFSVSDDKRYLIIDNEYRNDV